MVHVIKQRQANWIGHVLRHDCLLKTVLERKIEGKRPRGKPRKKMLGLLMEQEEKKISYEELKRRAQSRVGWRHRHWNLHWPEHAKRKVSIYFANSYFVHYFECAHIYSFL